MICSTGRRFEFNRGQRFFSLSLFGPISFLGLSLRRYYLNHNICLIVLSGQTLLVTPSLFSFYIYTALQHTALTSIFNFTRPLGVFHQEKTVFRLPSIIPYMARRQKSCFCVFKYRSSSTTDMFSLLHS